MLAKSRNAPKADRDKEKEKFDTERLSHIVHSVGTYVHRYICLFAIYLDSKCAFLTYIRCNHVPSTGRGVIGAVLDPVC
jgi:hypothetical protein